MYDFNSISNRLMQADYQDYNGVLSKFIKFIKKNEIIYSYIKDCGDCKQNLDKEFKEVSESYGEAIFSLGDSDEEEICNIFAILCYIEKNNILIHNRIALGYSFSTKYQDKVNGFNDRVVMVLIGHIERYLTKIGIDMGLDEKVSYSITVENGQVNISNDSSTINATNITNGIDIEKLSELIKNVKKTAGNIAGNDKEILTSSLDVIEEESKASKPRKSFLKTAIIGLKSIKGSAEFAVAIVTLIQFIQTLL